MGLDGGSIPSRSDMLRRASWRLSEADNTKSTRGGSISLMKEDNTNQKAELARIKWTVCAISGAPFREPIVACEMGKIYNREAVIEFLLGTGQFEYTKKKLQCNGYGHIKSVKNLLELNLTRNPQFLEDRAKEFMSTEIDISAPFICPISGVPANGRHQFIALKTCGHCFNEKALNETTSNTNLNCPMCIKEFKKEDILILNGNEEHVEAMEKEFKKKTSRRKESEEGQKRNRKGKIVKIN